jgi:hypothetical protein
MRRLVPVLVTTPLALVLAACSGSSGGSPQATGTTPPPSSPAAAATTPTCSLPAAKPGTKPPAGWPALSGVTWYQQLAVGATKVHFGYVTGSKVVTERNKIKATLIAHGFHLNDQDQEDNEEAEGDFGSSAHSGTLQVIHLCAGYLRVRLRIER